jgi:hypothetical protein
MIAARQTEERRKQEFGREVDFHATTKQPQGITGGGGEIIAARKTKDRIRVLDNLEENYRILA